MVDQARPQPLSRTSATQLHTRDASPVTDTLSALIASYENADGPRGLPALYGVMRLLAATVSGMPLRVTSGDPPAWMFKQRTRNGQWSMRRIREMWVTSMALRGVAYGTATAGLPNGWRVMPVHPDAVAARRRGGGEIAADWTLDGQPVGLLPENPERDRRRWLLHMPYLSTIDHPEGIGPLQHARLQLDGYLDTERHAANLFRAGTWSGGRLESDQDITAQTARRYQEAWVASRKLGKVPVLGSGLRYVNDVLPARDAQWIEARQFNQAQIWLMFGVPPDYMGASMTGGSSSLSYSNAQDNDRRFARNALRAFTDEIDAALTPLLREPGRAETEANAVVTDYDEWQSMGDTADEPDQTA